MSKEAKKREEREEVFKKYVQPYYLKNCSFTHFANKKGLLYLSSIQQTGTIDVF